MSSHALGHRVDQCGESQCRDQTDADPDVNAQDRGEVLPRGEVIGDEDQAGASERSQQGADDGWRGEAPQPIGTCRGKGQRDGADHQDHEDRAKTHQKQLVGSYVAQFLLVVPVR